MFSSRALSVPLLCLAPFNVGFFFIASLVNSLIVATGAFSTYNERATYRIP